MAIINRPEDCVEIHLNAYGDGSIFAKDNDGHIGTFEKEGLGENYKDLCEWMLKLFKNSIIREVVNA